MSASEILVDGSTVEGDMTMSKARRRFVKLAISASILGAGILPSSCQVRFRDAAINGALNYTTNTVSTALATLVPIGTLFGTE